MLDLNHSVFDGIMGAAAAGVPHRHRVDIAVIDTSLPDWQTLRDGMKAGTEIVLVGGHEDGLLALARALDGRAGIDAIHVLSHGFPGGLVVGSVMLDVTTLDSHRACLAAIGRCLSDDADILLYSCHTASGRGRDFLAGLADITGARVAASYNLTGAATLGGDWVLDYRSGDVELSIPLETAVIDGYQHTLSQPAYSSAVGYIGESTFDLSFDLALSETLPPLPGSFSVQVNGTGVNVGSVTVTGNNVTLTLQNTTLTAGDIIECAYTDPTVGDDVNAIQGLDGTDAAAFYSSTVVSGSRLLFAPTLTATGDTTTFVQGSTADVALFSGAAADTNDTGQTITGFTMTVSNVSDTTEFIGGFGPGISLVDGNGGLVGDPLSGGGSGIVSGIGPTETLTVTGLSLSNSDFDSLIDSLQYFNSAGTVTPGPRVITITDVTDSGSSNNVAALSGLFATVNVSATAPGPTVTETLVVDTGSSPSDNITYFPALNGNGDANATVTLTEGTTLLGTTTADGSGSWNYTPSLSDGQHTVVASETNSSGTGTASLTFTLESAAPPFPVTLLNDTGSSATDNVSNDVTLSGTGAGDPTVTLTEGATVLGTTTANGNGDWTFVPTLSDGPHTITAQETDTAGNSATNSLTFILDSIAPNAPVIASPDLSSNALPVISGTAEADSTVTAYVNGVSYTTIAIDGAWSLDLSSATPNSGTLSLNTNGPNLIYAEATDAAGNVSTLASQSLTIDTTAPGAPVFTSPDLTNSATPPLITGTAEAGSTVTLAGGGAIYAITVLPDGTWAVDLSTDVPTSGSLVLSPNSSTSFSATATDAAGNVSTAGAQTLTIDTTAPAAPAITSANLTSNTTPVIAGTAEAGSTVMVTVGGATYTTTAADGTWSIDLASAAPESGSLLLNDNGGNDVSATATDQAGNPSAAGTQTLTIDTTMPAMPAITSPNLSDSITPVVTGTAEAGSTVTLSIGGATYTTSAATDGTWTIDLSTPPNSGILTLDANGNNVASATATDAVGNMSAAGTQTLTIDTTAPAVPLINPLDPTRNATPVIAGTADAGSTVTVTVGGAIYTTTATNGRWSINLGTDTPTTGSLSLNDNGGNAVSVTARDEAGNVSAAGTQTLTIDTAAPAAPAITSPQMTDSIAPVITGTAEVGSTVTVQVAAAIYIVTASDGTWSINLATATPAAGILSLNDNGGNDISATAIDTAGNMSAAGTQTLTIDMTPPAAPAITSPGLTDSATPVIAGTAEAGSTIRLSIGNALYITTATANGGWSVNLASATPIDSSLSLDLNGDNLVSVTVTDAAGNVSAAGTQALTIDTTPPGVPAELALDSGSDSGMVGDRITNDTHPTITGTGQLGDTITLYDGEVAIGTATVVDGNWSITPEMALATGSHILTARQADTAGNMSAASDVLPLVIDAAPPAAPSAMRLAAGSDSGTAGDGITSATRPTIVGAGVAGNTVTIYAGTMLVGSATVDANGAWSFIPGERVSDGTVSLTATQTDPAGNVSAASAPFALTVDTTPPVVTAAVAANPHNTAGMTYNEVLEGGGEPDASVSISEGGMVLGTAQADAAGAWSFSPAGLAVGAHSLVASETDAAGNTGVSAAVPLTVDPSVLPDTRFSVGTGQAVSTGSFFGSDYVGPAGGGLQAQYGYVGTENVTIVANVPNVFIYSGAGDDALMAKAGSNVLDGGGGSNWMVGASGADGGTDTFFVYNPSGQNTWDTLLNFHVGDMLTVWDFNPAAGSFAFTDNLGAPGYTGLTIVADLGNGTGALGVATFAGMSSADAQFVTSTGTTGGLGYLAVTRVA